MSFLRLHNCSVAEPFLQQNCLDFYSRALPIAQRVKCLPAMRETWVQSLGRKDPQRRKWQPAQVLFAWKIPWTEKPGRLQSTGSQKSRTQLNDFTFSLLLNMPWEFRKRKKKKAFCTSEQMISRAMLLHPLPEEEPPNFSSGLL